jgi:phosphoserine phosphatase RsbU/P
MSLEKKQKPLILVVDDNTINIDLLVNALKDSYRLGVAKNGPGALKFARKNPPDLILLDIMMAEMDGYEVCQHLKADLYTRDIPVIFLTARSEPEYKAKGFSVGAIDYITKPFHTEEVKARVQAHLSLRKARDNEIEIAAKIQQDLLQGRPPKDIDGLQIGLLTKPSQKVDGDFFDFFNVTDHGFDLIIGDVMGKGITAALLGAAMRSHFLKVLTELSPFAGPCEIPEPEDIIVRAHTAIIDKLKELETFVTLCFARVDVNKSLLSVVNCGHMRTVHYQAAENKCRLIHGTNMPFGFPDDSPFKKELVDFKDGDFFFFYSDGLTEARKPDGTFYGETRLLTFLEANAQSSAEDLVALLWKNIVAFKQTEIFQDDLTCLLVKIDASHKKTSENLNAKIEIQSDLKELERVRAFVCEMCDRISNRKLSHPVSQVVLAANEVVSNIIKHSYDSQLENRIIIEASQTSNQLLFRFYDWGKQFDPNFAPLPVFDGTQESGFGLYLISKTVNKADHTISEDGTNCTTLTINITEA